MWEINSAEQIKTFFFAIILGIVFCIVYDFLKASRTKGRDTVLILFIEDIIYFFIFGTVTFLFLLVFCMGEIRAYVFIGEILGFAFCRFTFSKAVLPFFKLIFRFIYQLLDYLNKLYLRLLERSYTVFVNIFGFCREKFKNIKKLFKKLLKNA